MAKQTSYPESVPRATSGPPLPLWLVSALCGLALLVAAYQAIHRPPWSDEGWFSSSSYNLAHKGFFGNTVIEPSLMGKGLTRIAERTYWVTPGYLLAQAAWYKLVPATVFGTRALGLAFAILALVSLYLFLEKLFPRERISALATIILGTSFVFLDNAGFGRPDVMAMALGLAALAAYVTLRDRPALTAALVTAHALVALSGLAHPNGIIHWAVLVLVILWLDRGRIGWREVLTAAIPYAVLGALWGLYILEDPQAFVEQMRANGADGSNSRVAKTWNPLLVILNELRERYAVAFGLVTGGLSRLKLYALAIYFTALGLCLAVPDLRRRPMVRLLVAAWGVTFAIMCLFNQKLSYYLIHILPWYAVLAGVAGVWLWNRSGTLPRLLLAGALAGLLALEVGGIALKARSRSYIANQREALGYVKSIARPGDLIMGTAALIYEMDFDPRLLDDALLGIRSGRVPDLVIVDKQLYEPFLETLRQRPDEYRKVMERLTSYQKLRQLGEYTIYARPGHPAASTGAL